MFTRDEAGLPRNWSPSANIPAVAQQARQSAARLLALLAVIRLHTVKVESAARCTLSLATHMCVFRAIWLSYARCPHVLLDRLSTLQLVQQPNVGRNPVKANPCTEPDLRPLIDSAESSQEHRQTCCRSKYSTAALLYLLPHACISNVQTPCATSPQLKPGA